MVPIIAYLSNSQDVPESQPITELLESYGSPIFVCYDLESYCQLLAEVESVRAILFWDFDSTEELTQLVQLAQQTYDEEVVLIVADSLRHSRTRLRASAGHHRLHLISNSLKALEQTFAKIEADWDPSQTYAPDKAIIDNLLSVGGPPLIQKLVELFRRETPLKIIHAQLAAEEGRILDVFQTFHAVKGSCAMIGLMRLSQEADKVEQQALLNSKSDSQFVRHQLDHSIQTFLPKLDQALQSLKKLSQEVSQQEHQHE